MLSENHGPGDWTDGAIGAAKALSNAYNPHSRQRFRQEKSAGAGPWMIDLNDHRVSFNVLESDG